MRRAHAVREESELLLVPTARQPPNDARDERRVHLPKAPFTRLRISRDLEPTNADDSVRLIAPNAARSTAESSSRPAAPLARSEGPRGERWGKARRASACGASTWQLDQPRHVNARASTGQHGLTTTRAHLQPCHVEARALAHRGRHVRGGPVGVARAGSRGGEARGELSEGSRQDVRWYRERGREVLRQSRGHQAAMRRMSAGNHASRCAAIAATRAHQHARLLDDDGVPRPRGHVAQPPSLARERTRRRSRQQIQPVAAGEEH